MFALILSATLSLLVPVAGTAAEPRARITTDTAEYCRSLTARVAALPNAAEEPVRSIAEQGERLCREGHVRTGVAKLRRALRAAQSMAPPPLAPAGTVPPATAPAPAPAPGTP